MSEYFANLPDEENYLAQSLKSYNLLKDIGRAVDLLEEVTGDEQLFRLYWLLCLTLLATAIDVLNKDVKKYPEIHKIWKRRRNSLDMLMKKYKNKEYSDCPEDFVYWCRLFHIERNNIIHEYSEGFCDKDESLHLCATCNDVFDEEDILNSKDIYRPMGSFEQFGDTDCRDFIRGGLDWWEHEISSLVHAYLNTQK